MFLNKYIFSIRTKLTLIVFLMMTAILVTGLSIIMLYDFEHKRDDLVAKTQAYNKLLSQDMVKIITFGSVDLAADITAKLLGLSEIQGLIIFDTEHVPMYSYRKKGIDKLVQVPGALEYQPAFSENTLTLLEPVSYQEKTYGDVFMQISSQNIAAARATYIQQFLVIMLALSISSLLLIWLIQRYFTQPILRLVSTLHQTAETNDYSVRLPVKRKDEIGDLFYGFNTMQDKIQQANNTLEKSKERLDIAMSVANDGIWEWYLDNNSLVFDSRYYTLSGYEPDEFPAEYEEWEKRVHPDDIEAVKLIIEQYLSGKRDIFDVEFRFLCKGGDYMWIRGRGKIVARDLDGKPLYFVGTHSDINKSKQTEKALRRSQKMDAIGQLSGGIAHDFNNILGVILGNIELLELQAVVDDKIQKRVDTIKHSAQRAVDLTRQLLGFSRSAATSIKVTNINTVIESMQALIVHSLTPEVEVQHRFADNLWSTDIDPGDFEDALLNLVINARDAMNGRGKLTIESSNCTLDDNYCALNPDVVPGEYVQLAISDTGEGISYDQMDHIFEPFFTTKEQGKGTGLGLAMVFGFVKRSMGSIKVYSETGIGTTFRIFLPRTKREEQQLNVSSKKAESVHGGHETVLVVDDEKQLLDLVVETLQQQGYRVLTASNSVQALEKLADAPDIELLFSDVVMPGGINGYELAEQATAMYPELKVLLTSGFTEKAVARNGQAKFNANLISKPFTLRELNMRMRELLGETGASA
jgi:PAS domain S-box-containing protein